MVGRMGLKPAPSANQVVSQTSLGRSCSFGSRQLKEKLGDGVLVLWGERATKIFVQIAFFLPVQKLGLFHMSFYDH